MRIFIWRRTLQQRCKRKETEGRTSRRKQKTEGERKERVNFVNGFVTDGNKEKRAMGVEYNCCAFCLKTFVFGRGIKCSGCGIRVCRKNCSRYDKQFLNCWCCLFCYQQRIWLQKHQNWSITSDIFSINFEPPREYTGTQEDDPDKDIGEERNPFELLLQDNLKNGRRRLAPKLIQAHNYKPQLLSIDESIKEVATCILDKNVKNECENCLNFRNSHQVPFPELGMDIIDPYQEQIEVNEDEVNKLKHVNVVSLVQSWKENWLFQKKNICERPSSVAMFVPNSSAEYRAMIGDKDADETSDLSEYSIHSDEEIEKELVFEIKNIFSESTGEQYNSALNVNSNKSQYDKTTKVKTISITNDNIASDKKCDFKSLNSKDPENVNASNEDVTSVITRNTISKIVSSKLPTIYANVNLVNENADEKNINNIKCNVLNEQNQSVTKNECVVEHNSDPVHQTSTVLLDNPIGVNEIISSTLETDDLILSTKKVDIDNEINLFAPPIPGSVADREHKKWENAAPIKNNPYSYENINKRLVQRQYATKFSYLSSFTRDCSKRDSEVYHCGEAEIIQYNEIEQPNSNLTASKKSYDKNKIFDNGIMTNTLKTIDTTKNEQTKSKNEKREKLNNQEKLSSELKETTPNEQLINIKIQSKSIYDTDSKVSTLEKKELFENKLNFKSSEQSLIDKLDIQSLDYLQNNLPRSKSINDLNNIKFNEINFKRNLTKEKQFSSIGSLKTSNTCPQNENKSTTKLIKDVPRVSFSKISYKSVPDVINEIGNITKCITPNKCKQQENILLTNFNRNNYKNSEVNKEENLLNADSNININNINEKLSLPSVKELVQVFNEKQNALKNRQLKSQPIRINQLSKQLHSLTARSLSKEFRDELRQISNKSDLHDANRRRKIPDNILEKENENNELDSDNVNIFEHEKLKSSIEFWERIQNQN